MSMFNSSNLMPLRCTVFLALAIWNATTAQAQQVPNPAIFQMLHPFNEQNPRWLFKGTDGNIYGTDGVGVSRYSTDGTVTPLFRLRAERVMQGKDGNFYAVVGLTSDNNNYTSEVDRITPQGQITVLHTFEFRREKDTSLPMGGVIPGRILNADGKAYWSDSLCEGSDGTLYGTTAGGGSFGNGTIYKITSNGSYQKIYDFGGADIPSLYQSNFSSNGPFTGKDGNIYFAAQTPRSGQHLYRVSPSGQVAAVYATDDSIGCFTVGRDGNVYGCSSTRNKDDWWFTINLAPGGKFSFQHDLQLARYRGLIQGDKPDYNFYGIALTGSYESKLYETILQITPQGRIKLIWTFLQDNNSYGNSAFWTVTKEPYGFNVTSLVAVGGYVYGIVGGKNGGFFRVKSPGLGPNQ